MIRPVGLAVGVCGMFLMVGSLLCLKYGFLIFLCGAIAWVAGFLMITKGDRFDGR